VHHNVPGVLSAINQVFAQHGLNIVGQYLRTDEKLGYVVMDIGAEAQDLPLAQMAEITGTIRCRVLF
jgi:D-3-phosphoglycerate dehydrogenase